MTARRLTHTFIIIALLAALAAAWLAAQPVPEEQPLCTIAAISSLYITALPAGEIKDGAKGREWLKESASKGLNAAIEAANTLKPDVMLILGSLTWTGSEADFAELKPYLARFNAPLLLAPGARDLAAADLGDVRQRLAGHTVELRHSTDLGGVHIQVAVRPGPSDETADKELLDWMAGDLEGAKGARAVLVVGGPGYGADTRAPEGLDTRYFQMMRDSNVAACLGVRGHSHMVHYTDSLPTWTIPSSGWSSSSMRPTLALITVYPRRVVLDLLNGLDQPRQRLVVPNPVAAPRMTTAADDPHGVPTYTEDLALKPELTFIQLADSQFDDLTTPAGERYKYAPQMNTLAVEQANRLKPPLVFLAGDLTNKNTVAEWTTLQGIYSKLTVPLYTVPGNHDHGGDDMELKNYRKFTAQFASGGKPNYTVEKNGCVFICLNTHTQTIDDAQMQWFRGELERTKDANHVFVVGHHPVLPAYGGNVEAEGGGDEVLRLLKQYKVAAYLAGHRHRYNYRLHEGTAHILCNSLSWGERLSYEIYHVFPDKFVACWKPIYRQIANRPLYERVEFPEPRRN